MRKLASSNNDWDQPLPPEHFHNWNQWTTSLSNLQQFQIPRTYLSSSFAQSKDTSVHIFCDASENAIAAVAYIHARNNSGSMELGFILGKSNVAPVHGHTIPRLELCSAVLSTQIAETIAHHLQLPICEFKLYTDSKVILGYINNESRRFFNYVINRVQKIRSCTHPHPWHYVHTDINPADKGTRTLPASKISDSTWIKGPAFLLEGDRKQKSLIYKTQK